MNYVGMVITRELQTLDENGDAVATPELTFKWQLGDVPGTTANSIVPTVISTGRYQVEFIVTVKEGGVVYYRWDTDGATDVAKEGRLYVKPSVFTQ